MREYLKKIRQWLGRSAYSTSLPAGIYRHYKGGLYLLIGVGQHTETNEWLVVYVALTGAHLPGPRIRIRPLGMFLDEISLGDSTALRFEYVGFEAPQPPPARPGEQLKLPGV